MNFEEIVKNVPAVIYECLNDTDWTMLYLSPYIREISGYEAEHFISGKIKYSQIVHPEDIELVNKAIHLSDKIKTSFNIEYRIIDKNKNTHWVWEIGVLSQSNNQLFGLILDTTKQAELRSKLNTYKNELENFFNISLQKLCIANTDGKFLKINKAWQDLGYTNDELLRIPFLDLVHPDDLQLTLDEIDKLASGVPTISFVNRYKCKDGNYKILDWATTPDAETGLLYAAARDITLLKDSEKQLSKITNYLEEAQKVAKIGSWSFDLTTQNIEWSKQMFELFPEDIKNGPPSFTRHRATIHPDDLSTWTETVNTCAKDGRPYKMRFRSVFPDKIIWIEAIGEGIKNKNGSLVGLHGTCQDITEKVDTEEVMQAQRAMTLHASKLASLGEMSASIAHEINNPLAIIRGALDSIDVNDLKRDKLISRLSMIERSAFRIEKIVTGLRRFTRAPGQTNKEYTEISKIINDSLIILDSKAKNKDVNLTFEILDNVVFYCDPLEIEQVLVNLISNAIDAAAKCDVKWVKLLVFTTGNDLTLLISDSGSDITSEIEKKLFQPFFTTKNIGEGTGLGLSISKQIIEDHNGSISLKQKKPYTCFEILLPKLR